jgi:hypothetical protein
MQHSIALERLTRPPTVIGQTDAIQMADLDRNIRSVTVLRDGQSARQGESQQIRDYGTRAYPSEIQDTFVVEDLFDGISYLVARTRSGYQVTFGIKDGQVIVVVDPSVDVTQLAHELAWRLMKLETHKQWLGPQQRGTGQP